MYRYIINMWVNRIWVFMASKNTRCIEWREHYWIRSLSCWRSAHSRDSSSSRFIRTWVRIIQTWRLVFGDFMPSYEIVHVPEHIAYAQCADTLKIWAYPADHFDLGRVPTDRRNSVDVEAARLWSPVQAIREAPSGKDPPNPARRSSHHQNSSSPSRHNHPIWGTSM